LHSSETNILIFRWWLGTKTRLNPCRIPRSRRDILKIRCLGGESPGGGSELVIGGVDTFRFRIYNLQKSVYIGGTELFQSAVLEYNIGYLILLSDEREGFVIDRISGLDLLGNRDSEFLEENHLHLFGGVDIEPLADEIIDLQLFILGFPGDIFADGTKLFFIHIHSRSLHFRKDDEEFWFHIKNGLKFWIQSIFHERLFIGKIRPFDGILLFIFRYLIMVFKIHKHRKIEVAVDGGSEIFIVTDIEKRHSN